MAIIKIRKFPYSFIQMCDSNFYRGQQSCGKVIFSQECVKNSVHGGGELCLAQCMLGYTPPGQTPPGQTPPWADTPLWADTPPRQTPTLGRPPPLQQTATAADDTHPTGMHSCSRCFTIHFEGVQECKFVKYHLLIPLLVRL